jgi:hypothetical protein
VGLAAGVAGPISTTVDTGVAVDVGTSGVTADVSIGTAIDAGPISTTVDTGTAVDLTSGTVSTGVDTSISAGAVEVPVATSTAVDLSTGTVNLDVSVAGVELGANVDLGLGTNQADTSPTTPATDTGTTVLTDVGGLLNGLIRRPGGR